MKTASRPVLFGGILIMALCNAAPGAVSDRIHLDDSTRARCLQVLRDGLQGSEFWPAMHAAEALTLAGHGMEVIETLRPRLSSETDAQRRCGLLREIARAGDRSTVSGLIEILTAADPYGHVHAAESLFKIGETGDGTALRLAAKQDGNSALRVMAAAALARNGDAEAQRILRDMLAADDVKAAGLAAWALGQLDDPVDAALIKARLSAFPDAASRAFPEHALALLGDTDGLQALTRNLHSPDETIRTPAAAFAGDARATEAASVLITMLDDSFPDARIRAAQSLIVLNQPPAVRFVATAAPVFQELNPGYCWFHPRAAAMPGFGEDGQPAVILTLQKHLIASDHYSGLAFMRTNDLGKSWSKPVEIPELAWQTGDSGETIGVCDVTPGWHAHSGKLVTIGIRLRYSAEGVELLDKPRSHSCAWATFDPATGRWTPWQSLEMPEENGKFYLVAPGCVQWLENPDGTLLIPAYVRRPEGGVYTSTVLHCSFDGQQLRFLANGDELTIPTGRGLYEPSLVKYGDRFFLTLRSDDAAYVTTSSDGLHFSVPQKWTFDDGSDLGSYNTQAHWLTHSRGLFLTYTRRGAGNDHIMRNRAPIFVAQVDPDNLQVLRNTERILLPERGVMLGNFGAAAITEHESWVTDAEYIEGGQPHPRGADGTTWLGRIRWSTPNQTVSPSSAAAP